MRTVVFVSVLVIADFFSGGFDPKPGFEAFAATMLVFFAVLDLWQLAKRREGG